MPERILTELTPPPVESSVHRPWSGMTVQLHDWRTAGSVASPSLDHDLIAMRISGRVRLTQSRAGRVHRSVAVPGNVTVHARGTESRWSWDAPGAIVVARVAPEVLAEAAAATMRRAEPVELQQCFGVRDDFAESLLRLMAQELRRPAHALQAVISGCLSAAFVSHLVNRFNVHDVRNDGEPDALMQPALDRVIDYAQSGDRPLTLAALADIAGVSRYHFARRFRQSTGQGIVQYLQAAGLPRSKPIRPRRAPRRGLATWQVRRVTGHMMAHLDQQLRLDELAGLLKLSRAHFCTAFRLAVGVTPREWLIARRMERASSLLAAGGTSVTEVAAAVGYTPSAFGALFRAHFGVAPSAFRRARQA